MISFAPFFCPAFCHFSSLLLRFFRLFTFLLFHFTCVFLILVRRGHYKSDVENGAY
jgi:hypothetical protein